MKVFLDSCIFFDYLKDYKTKSTIRHAKNNGHKLVTSITVLGEIVSVCVPRRLQELYDIIEVLKELDVEVIHPQPLPNEPRLSLLRECCMCLDAYHAEEGIYGSSLTDRTHLAYATMYDCDFFVTSSSEVKALRTPNDCPRKVEVVDIDSLRKKLGY